MTTEFSTPQSVQTELHRYLDQARARLRWATLGALLLLTLMRPLPDGRGLAIWLLLALFAAYCLIMDWLQPRLPWLQTFAHRAILDILATAAVYSLGAEPGGPLFVLFFLCVNFAATGMTVRGMLKYTVAVAAILTTIDLVLFVGASTASDIRMVGVRAIMLVVVGVGMAMVTRRLMLEQAATQVSRDQTEQLAEIDKLRAEFLSTVSHELRTPITAARAGLGLIETSTVDRLRPDEQGLLSNARRNIERLSILIDDLLSYNLMGAGTLHLDRERLDLRIVVTDSLSAVYPLILEKGQTLEIVLPEPLPYQGDARQLEQVVVNLLANAHRHTPARTRITITGWVTPTEVCVSISDNGEGIPPKELEAIFERFHRLRLKDQGSGLGLAIAKAVVELHGGRLWAESKLGAGATFTFALPDRTNGGAS